MPKMIKFALKPLQILVCFIKNIPEYIGWRKTSKSLDSVPIQRFLFKQSASHPIRSTSAQKKTFKNTLSTLHLHISQDVVKPDPSTSAAFYSGRYTSCRKRCRRCFDRETVADWRWYCAYRCPKNPEKHFKKTKK